MAVPWLRIIDTVLNLTDMARGRQSRSALAESPAATGAGGGGALGHFEARLAGVVVAALKEAFDRDSKRIELERDQMEAERERAERLLRIELVRQAGEREIGRLRLLAGVAFASWVGTLFFSPRLMGAAVAARVLLGIGWLLLLASLALAFAAQSSVSRALTRADSPSLRADDLQSGGAADAVPWLIVLGLAAVGVAVLVA